MRFLNQHTGLTAPQLGDVNQGPVSSNRFEGILSDSVWCKCGKPVLFSNETRCEDCFADDAEKYARPSPHVDLRLRSAREQAVVDKRSDEVLAMFAGGKSNAVPIPQKR